MSELVGGCVGEWVLCEWVDGWVGDWMGVCGWVG